MDVSCEFLEDIYTKVNVPYTTAVLGGNVRVHTLYGDVECKIKEGTQYGTKIRLKGKVLYLKRMERPMVTSMSR